MGSENSLRTLKIFFFIPQFTIINAFYNTIAHWSKFLSIYKGAEHSSLFYKWKTMDDNQKKFIPPLAIDTKFFHCLFVNPCKTKGAVGAEWAAFGWKVERVPGCREDFLLSSQSALLCLLFSNLLGFAGRLLAKSLLTAVLAAGVSLHVKLSCCPSCFVSSTNLAGVPFTSHSQYSDRQCRGKLWIPESV